MLRYGAFSDRVLELPKREVDFHLIVGPNEAGKSTLRCAIRELLYGIDKSSAYAFKHGYGEMKIGGKIQHGGSELAFCRTKGNKNTLKSPADEVLADTVLAPFLGKGDEAFFQRMYALDLEGLVKGGKTLLSASDDLGRALFQSAAGLSSMGDLIKRLDEQCDGLWGPKKKAGRVYYDGLDAFQAAQKALNDSVVRSKDWAKAQAEYVAADKEHGDTVTQRKTVSERIATLQRLRRVRPDIATLKGLLDELVAQDGVIDLGEAARSALDESNRVLMEATAEEAQVNALIEEVEARVKALPFDAAVVDCKAEIAALNELRVQIEGYRDDVRTALLNVESQWTSAQASAAEVSLDARDEGTLVSQMPGLAAQTEMQSLVATHGSLTESLRQACAAVSAKRRDVADAQGRQDQLGQTSVPAALSVALAAAVRLGDVEARAAELGRTLKRTEREENAAYEILGEWRCDESSLRQMTVPHAESVARHVAELQACVADLRSVSTALQDKDDAKALQVARNEAFVRSNKTVSADQVLAARGARDGLWGAIEQDPSQVLPQAGKFKELLKGADSLADDRFATAAADGTLTGYLDQLQTLESEIEQAEKRKGLLEGEKARLESEWQSITTAAGLQGMQALAVPAWTTARVAALASSETAAQARDALDEWNAVCEQATTALRLAMGEEASASDTLPLLIEKAKRIVKAAETASVQADELVIQQRQNNKDLRDLLAAEADAQEALAQWASQWNEALVKGGFPPGLDATGAAARLAVYGTIAAALKEIARLRKETVDRRRNQELEFEESAGKLVTRLGREMAGRPASDVVAELHLQAEAFARNQEETKGLQIRSFRLNERLEAAKKEILRAQGLVQPLMLRAGVEAVADLVAKVDASDKRRATQARREEVEVALVAAGDGRSVAELQDECSGVDASGIAAELSDLETQDQALVTGISERAVRREQALGALNAISGSDAAARAAGDRQQAVGVMADAVESFIFAKASERVLRWAVERYRETQQGPMLVNASKHFKRLTLGSFEKLTVDFDHDPPKLEGKRADGPGVPVSGMSDGTRDQLFLALRLAGLEMQLASGHGMPFIGDDLFINFDDGRSEAGLACLGELSKQTQVIFLTHHEHLVEPAKRVLGAELNVVRL